MKKFFAKRGLNEDGSVLLAVLTIMTFAAILAATAFGFVQTASQTSYQNEREKQAYYTAATCLETFVDSVLTPNSPNWEKFQNIAAAGGSSDPIDLDGMGTCVITVEKPTGMSYIKVTATATMSTGEEESVACIMKTATKLKKAAFNNALELIGTNSAAYDNLNVLGNMAGSKDVNDDMVYKFDNEAKISGKYFQYGTVEPKNNISFENSITGEGCSLTATKYVYFANNENKVISNIKKEDNNKSNYVFAGNTFVQNATHTTLGKDSSVDPATGVRTGDVDLYAGGVVLALQQPASSHTDFSKSLGNTLAALEASNVTTNSWGGTEQGFQTMFGKGNSYTQYGNIYCYSYGGSNSAGKTDAALAGNFVVDAGSGFSVNIHGDVYIEGNLYITSGCNFHVYGNLYVGGTINGTITMHTDPDRAGTGKIYCGGTTGAVYEPLGTGVFSTIKATGRGATPTAEYDGTKYIYYPEDLLISSDNKVSTISSKYKAVVSNPASYSINNYSSGTDAASGVTFDRVITGSCYLRNSDMNNINNILIKVTGDDIVIVFENGLNLNNGRKIIVQNTTKDKENSESDAPGICYFTVDTYTAAAKVEPVYKTNASGGFVLDDSGNKIVEDSKHSGFIENAQVYLDNVVIGDYDTWRNASAGYTVAGVGCGSLPLNLTGREIPGTYDPGNGFIIFLLTKGTKWQAQNACQFEGTFYANEANFVYNATAPSAKLATGDNTDPKLINVPTIVIGSLIVGQCTIGNTSYIAYCPPSSKSNLSNVSGESDGEQSGYEVLKYTQDMS